MRKNRYEVFYAFIDTVNICVYIDLGFPMIDHPCHI